jgi:dihydropyrimidinase/allantoinase
MIHHDLVIKGAIAIIPGLGATRMDIGIADEKIVTLSEDIPVSVAEEVIDARGKVVFPGAIDSHFHVGIYRPFAEDAVSESAAAVTGGVTTILSYFRTGSHYLHKTGPYREIFPEVLTLSRERFLTDYGYHLALMTDEHLSEMEALIESFGVSTFKYYMFYKNLDLAGTSVRGADYIMADAYDYGFLYQLMWKIAKAAQRHHGRGRIALSLHCENPEIIRVTLNEMRRQGHADLRAFSAARPPLSEWLAIQEAGVLAQATGCPINLLHLSSREAVLAALTLRRERPDLNIVCEVTLHHLTLTEETGLGVLGKVNPPLRTREDVEFLWQAIAHGHIDTVGSDHACLTRAMKGEEMWSALPGFGGTSLLYPLMISEGFYKRGLSLERIAELVAQNPARAHGLWPKKGTIAIGSDADLTIIDMEKEQVVNSDILNSAQDFTPFEGMLVRGWPTLTLLRGHVVFERGRIVGHPGVGRFIKRPVGLHADLNQE